MSSSRVYAAASGQCLLRGADGLDETERDLVQREFHAGVRLAIDPVRGEVRGVVPSRRRSEELFYAVVRPDADEPLSVEAFHAAVAEVFQRRDRWTIRTDTPEGRPFRQVLGDGEKQSTESENGTETVGTADEPDDVLKSTTSRLRERTAADPPVTADVATFGEGLALLEALRESGLDPASTGGAVVARTASVDHLDPALAVRIRDGETESSPTDEATSQSSAAVRFVVAAGLLGGALLIGGGLARGDPVLTTGGIGAAAAALLLFRQ